MKKIVYVTGCLGFIGSYVTAMCLQNGWFVRGIDKLTYAANEKLLLEFNKFKNFTFQKEDINDLKFLYDCDYIINTAAETHVDNSIAKSDDFLKSNVDGVHNLLELIKNNRCLKRPMFIHFSTDEVYGDIEGGAHKETDKLKPSNPYSATKAAADMLINAWARTYDINYLILRPTNNYGIGQYVEKLVPKSCKYMMLKRKIQLHENGTPVRTWLHARDTAMAVMKLIESDVKNDIYNISGNVEQTNLVTVTKILKEYLGTDQFDIMDYVDMSYKRLGQDVRYSVDDSKLRSLGWKNECLFDTELPSIIKYYKENFIW